MAGVLATAASNNVKAQQDVADACPDIIEKLLQVVAASNIVSVSRLAALDCTMVARHATLHHALHDCICFAPLRCTWWHSVKLRLKVLHSCMSAKTL